MRRTLIAAVSMLVLFGGLPVSAQETPPTETSFDPYTRVLDSFIDGDGIVGLTVDVEDPNSPIPVHFQQVINFGDGPAFQDDQITAVQSGWAGDGSDEIVSLEDKFSPAGDRVVFIPPLHPLGEYGPDGVDITEAVAGWTAYGEEGLIEGAVHVVETPTVVWGIELTEPFDESCSADRVVGRAWFGDSAVSASPPFEEGDLEDAFFSDSHNTLAGEFNRVIELHCRWGEPRVNGIRQTDNIGVRDYGPLDVIALVKGNHVVFMHPLRQLNGNAEGVLYANPGAGGAIETVERDPEIGALIPNFYDDLPVRIELTHEAEEAGNTDYTPRLLLFDPESPPLQMPVGFQCRVAASVLFGFPIDNSPEIVFTWFWLQYYSLWVEAAYQLGRITYSVNHTDGTVENVDIDTQAGTWNGDVTQGPGTNLPDCNTGGTASASGPGIEAAPDNGSGEAGDGGEPTETTPTTIPDNDTDDSNNIVFWIAAAGVAAGGAVAAGRSLSRRRSCVPEHQAHERAMAEYERAREHQQDTYDDLRAKEAEVSRLREANRYLIAGDERDAAADEALPGAEAEMAAAQRALDLADQNVEVVREEVTRAYHALLDCREEAGVSGGLPPPPPAPEPTPEPGPDSSQQPECSPDGATEVRPEAGLPSASFLVVGGNVLLPGNGPIASWNQTFGGRTGGVSGEAFVALDSQALDTALGGAEVFDNQANVRFSVTVEVPVATVKAECGRVWECRNGTWVRTNRTDRLDDVTVSVVKETFTSRGPGANTLDRVKEAVAEAQERVRELEANRHELETYGC